jgi:protein Shroom
MGNIAVSEKEDQPQPTSHHCQAVCSEKRIVVTSVIDCNYNKESSARTSGEVQLGKEETHCSVTQSLTVEEHTKVTVNVETETQCDIPEAETTLPVDSHSPPPPPPLSPTAQHSIKPQVMESLQLVQRSEVILRVNAATSDAASQTESEREVLEVVSPLVRQKLQEEIECEKLSLDLASHLPPSDKLQGLLVPVPEHKKPTDYVSGLFKLDVTQRPRVTISNTATSQTTAMTVTNMTATATKLRNTTTASMTGDNVPAPTPAGNASSEEVREPADNTVSPLSASSAYFTTSESKAKFLTQYGRDMKQSEQMNGLQDNKDLQQKKEELMARLDRKLQVLRGEHLVVTEESRVNDELGESVAVQVSHLAQPHEASKYRLHVEEVGKITSLLLGLSGRLARAENALMGLPLHHSERKILESKRDKLREQLEEAKKLKENIDRRSVCVSNILYKYFNAEEYADYDHFINMKAKLIMDSREIADKIKLGEEQLAALKETLSASD